MLLAILMLAGCANATSIRHSDGKPAELRDTPPHAAAGRTYWGGGTHRFTVCFISW
jgi:hypothetical protein